MNNTTTPALDRFEATLPPITRRVFRLNRRIVEASFDAASGATKALCSATKTVSKRASDGVSTVSGQAVSVADRVGTATQNGVNEVVGQAKAQARATIDTLEDETITLLDEAEGAVEDSPSGAYESWSKAELYERSQVLGIEGRSTMSKAQLIDALRSA